MRVIQGGRGERERQPLAEAPPGCLLNGCPNPAEAVIVWPLPPWSVCLYSCWDHRLEAKAFAASRLLPLEA